MWMTPKHSISIRTPMSTYRFSWIAAIARLLNGLVVWSVCVAAAVTWSRGYVALAATPENALKEQESCSVPNVTEELQAALCSADAGRLRDAIFHVDTGPGHRERQRMLAAFRRVYAHDPHFGSNLPWEKLSMPGPKAVLLDPLAQAVRNHEIDMSLADLREAAKEIVAVERDVDQFEGVRLLGLTDDVASVPLLRQMATPGNPSVKRHKAIEALGYICDPAAKAALQDLAKNTQGLQPDDMLVHAALGIRERLDESWCRK